MAQVASVLNEQLCFFPLGVDVRKLREERDAFLTFSRSAATQRTYARDFKIFSNWCSQELGQDPLPCSTETLELFISNQLTKGFKVSTVSRRMASILFTHKKHKLESPKTASCREILKSARIQRREKQNGKKALEVHQLVQISKVDIGKPNTSRRDQALLIFGFASGLRRSEIARLDLDDVKVTDKGLVVSLNWSKTDQAGEGRVFGIFAGRNEATDPVRTMRAWLKARGRKPGPLFTGMARGSGDVVTLNRLSDLGVNRIVHRALKRIGVDPKPYGAHSLRAGLVTAAAENGASESQIMRASGHKSPKVMRKYIRPAVVFAKSNPLAGVL